MELGRLIIQVRNLHLFFEKKEFITACMDEQIFLKKERLIQTFKLFDLDGSGKISMSELKQIF